jgi:hypothetical protein
MMFFPDCSTVIRGAPRLVTGASRLVASTCRWSQVHHTKFSPVLRGVPKLITITPLALLRQPSEISVAPKASRNALVGSNTLLKLMHLSFHSTSSQTLLETSSVENTFCWWASDKIMVTIYADSDNWRWALTRPGLKYENPLTRSRQLYIWTLTADNGLSQDPGDSMWSFL